MNRNIVEFPDRKAIEEEAGAWLVKLDGDTAPSAEELASLREWLERSPVHREQLAKFAGLWGKMNVLTELSVPLGRPEKKAKRSSYERLRHTMPQFVRVGVSMAVLLVGIGAAAMFWLRPDPLLNSNGFYSTAVGQQESTTLADGSVVLLNTNSQIKVDYGDEYRVVRLLQGEAHFTVAENAERPFQVYAGGGRVQAVGTAFSVYLKDNAIDVTVTEGSVAVSSVHGGNSSPTPQLERNQSSGATAIIESDFVETLGTVKAGESVTLQGTDGSSSQSRVNVIETIEAREMTRRLSWRGGMLTFAGDRLEDVVNEISRYTTVSIEISDPAVRARSIGGRFPIGETDAMFDALEANFGLRVVRLGHNRVLVSAAEE